MTVMDKIAADVKVIGTSVVTISTVTTTNFDFGTPNDIKLDTITAAAPGLLYEAGYRIVVVFSASTSGSTDTVAFSVQDADDDGGNIGTPGAADTDGTLTGGTGSQFAVTSVRLRSGKPWLRCRVSSDGTDDTFIAHCTVLAIPRAL
jgi:hypothetical protein